MQFGSGSLRDYRLELEPGDYLMFPERYQVAKERRPLKSNASGAAHAKAGQHNGGEC